MCIYALKDDRLRPATGSLRDEGLELRSNVCLVQCYRSCYCHSRAGVPSAQMWRAVHSFQCTLVSYQEVVCPGDSDAGTAISRSDLILLQMHTLDITQRGTTCKEWKMVQCSDRAGTSQLHVDFMPHRAVVCAGCRPGAMQPLYDATKTPNHAHVVTTQQDIHASQADVCQAVLGVALRCIVCGMLWSLNSCSFGAFSY